MRKLTVSVVALALTLAILAFGGTTALGDSPTMVGPTVTATAQPLGIKLDWTYPESAGAVGYIIRRGETAGREERWPVTDFPVTGNTWLDEEINPGTTYYYVVVPVLKDGAAGFDSAEVSATAVGLAADRRLVHFHMDATEALTRTADGEAKVALAAQPRVEHGRVMVAMEDLVTLAGADLSRSAGSPVVSLKLAAGRVLTMEVNKPSLTFTKATWNDNCHPLELNGHVYLPLRWIVEAMDGQLSFNPADGSVTFVLAR
ncbi:MAG TPA: stalk domain-containing protein [Symbiobacteriaceae bacterium]|nr:stalk domain-containing protein [Symbiobacteriaceae bacterium]